jgi:hypothetical protein
METNLHGDIAMQTPAVQGPAAVVAVAAAAKQLQQEQQQQQTRRLKPALARSPVHARVRVMGGDSSNIGSGVQPEAVGGCDPEHDGGASGSHSEKGGDGWRAEGAGVQHGQDWQKSPRGGGGGHVGGDGQEQAGGAGPLLPGGPEQVEFAGADGRDEYWCRCCNIWCNGKEQWDDHLVGKKHLKRKTKARQLASL